MTEHKQEEKGYFFENPKNIKIVVTCCFVILAILLVGDLLIHKHAHFSWENWPEFYAVFGFVAFVFVVLVAKYILRPLVKRREDYYD